MEDPGSDPRTGTVVIGGGQAGLAVGYHLGRRRLPFVVLDAPFLHSPSSSLLGGVGRDARYVVDHVASRRVAAREEAGSASR